MLINQASLDQLAALPDVERHTAEIILRERPFQAWAEVRHCGVSMDQIDALKRAGVEFGGASAGPIEAPGSGGSAASPEGNLGRA